MREGRLCSVRSQSPLARVVNVFAINLTFGLHYQCWSSVRYGA